MFLYIPIMSKMATPSDLYTTTLDVWADMHEVCEFYNWMKADAYDNGGK